MLSPWGYGSIRAMYPDNLNGPYGSPGKPIPAYSLGPSYKGPVPYRGEGVIAVQYGKRGCSFGSTHLLTPGGVSTENSWGLFSNFGKKKSKKSKKKRSYKRISKPTGRKSLCRPQKFGKSRKRKNGKSRKFRRK